MFKHKKRSREELYTIAKDIIEGKIFTSLNFDCENEIGILNTFMPLLMIPKEKKDFLKDIAFIFEYLDQAAPRGINGKPMFFSFQSITKEEYKEFQPMFNKLIELEEKNKKEILNE